MARTHRTRNIHTQRPSPRPPVKSRPKYSRRKGRELVTNPLAALTSYWSELERQVRVEGQVRRISRHQSEAYFRMRPKGSRLGAWASHQSQVLPSREPLEARLKELEAA